MRTSQVQKTIISKYLALAAKESVTESEIVELHHSVGSLYKSRMLSSNDTYRQKIEIIVANLTADLDKVKRKRTSKEVKLKVNPNLNRILENDIPGVDYSAISLSELNEVERDEELSISVGNVKAVLGNLVIAKRRLASKLELEKFVADQLALVFGKHEVHRQYSVGGHLALKTDIDVGNGQVGIEVKIADGLNATDMQRMIGQLLYYKKRSYTQNLVVLLASRTTISSTLKELTEIIEEIGITVVFTTAINL